MAAVSICSDLEPKIIKSATASTISPSLWHEVMGPHAMIFVFWMLSLILLSFTGELWSFPPICLHISLYSFGKTTTGCSWTERGWRKAHDHTDWSYFTFITTNLKRYLCAHGQSHCPAFQPPAPLDSYSHSLFLSSPILTQLTEKTTRNKKEEIKRELLQLSHRKIMPATQIQTYSHTLLLGEKKIQINTEREKSLYLQNN